MDEPTIPTDLTDTGEYAPAGEAQGEHATFTVADVITAFAVAPERVQAAVAGEFGGDAGTVLNSRQAQHLAEVILGDQPLADREAALMKLGAFTPRPDQNWGLGEKAPGEESAKLKQAD